jgi:hypothetical protein
VCVREFSESRDIAKRCRPIYWTRPRVIARNIATKHNPGREAISLACAFQVLVMITENRLMNQAKYEGGEV